MIRIRIDVIRDSDEQIIHRVERPCTDLFVGMGEVHQLSCLTVDWMASMSVKALNEIAPLERPRVRPVHELLDDDDLAVMREDAEE